MEDAFAAPGLSLPDLTKPEEGGIRSFGREEGEGRYVHAERLDFSQDVGYHGAAILRRAQAAVARALDASGKSAGEDSFRLATMPTFGPERALTVIVVVD